MLLHARGLPERLVRVDRRARVAARRRRLADLEVEVGAGALGVAGVAHVARRPGPCVTVAPDDDVGREGLARVALPSSVPGRVVVDVEVVVGPAVGGLDRDGVAADDVLLNFTRCTMPSTAASSGQHLRAHEVLALVGVAADAAGAEGVGVGHRAVDREHDRLHDVRRRGGAAAQRGRRAAAPMAAALTSRRRSGADSGHAGEVTSGWRVSAGPPGPSSFGTFCPRPEPMLRSCVARRWRTQTPRDLPMISFMISVVPP